MKINFFALTLATALTADALRIHQLEQQAHTDNIYAEIAEQD